MTADSEPIHLEGRMLRSRDQSGLETTSLVSVSVSVSQYLVLVSASVS